MNIWDQLVDCICRPPRDVYTPAELLGGSNQTFMVGQMECARLDFELTNQAGLKLQCSHYLPLDARSQDGQLPVVVYCHCNSGSRRDAEEALYHLLPCGVGVVAFDFTGSGLSDGKWVTLGANEVQDLGVVVRHLRAQGGVSSIGLWGRSMGAVTALLYSHQDPDIAGMVLDSPFSRLTDLMLEIVVSQRLPIPKVMLKLALRLMRNSVRRKAGADINGVSPLDVVAKSAIPAMFGHGEEDSFIHLQHSVKLFEAYNSAAEAPVYKNLVRFKGDHNHPRPAFFYSSVCCFFHQQLKLDQVLLGGNPADTQQLMKYGSLSQLSSSSAQHEVLDRANGFVNTPWSLEPVSSLSREDQEAAAAAAAALMTQPDDGCGGGSSNQATPQPTQPNGASGSSSRSGGGGLISGSSSGHAGPSVVKGGSQQAAAAAAATLACSNGGISSSSGGGVLPSLRINVRSSGSGSAHNASSAGAAGAAAGAAGAGGVAHISEGGLNSPCAAAAAAAVGHKGSGVSGGVVSVDAGAASSSSSSGGGMQGRGTQGAAAAAAAAVAASGINTSSDCCYESMEQQEFGISSPSSPQSPRFQQRLRSNSYTQRHQQLVQYRQLQQLQQQQSGGLASPRTTSPERQQRQQQGGGPAPLPLPLLQQQQQGYALDTSWQLASAVPIAAAQPRQRGTSDDLFTVGSRGAPADAAGTLSSSAQPGGSSKQGGISLSLAAEQQTAAAAAAAASGGAAAGPTNAAVSGASPGRASRGVSGAGSQPLKWLFKRSGSSGSTAGSTPSTSPPAAAAAAAAASGGDSGAHVWRSKSAGTAGAAARQQQQLPPPPLRVQGLDGVNLQQQQQQLDDVPLSPLRSSRPSLTPAGGGSGGGLRGLSAVASPTAATAAAAAAGSAGGADNPADDPALTAAIAASLADQQAQQALQLQHPDSRSPQSVDEEQRMLQEAIALSLSGPLPQQS